MAAKRQTGTKRDKHLVRGLSHKLFEIIQAMEVLGDDELEGIVRELKQCREDNCWFVTYQNREALLRIVRDEQNERRRRKTRVLDKFDMFRFE